MEYSFTKMEGCGNDYIYFNCFEQPIEHPEAVSIPLSDRHFGIGGDGIVLICPSDVADAKMRMFNADGSEGKMCGNAIRCVGKYLYDRGIVPKQTLTVETLSGIKTLALHLKDGKVDTVTVQMGKAELSPQKIPVFMEGDRIIGKPLAIGSEEYKITCVSMGNPHCVVFCDDPEGIDLPGIGPLFETHPLFPERINTEFVKVTGSQSLSMRVWERGSGETWACGTGACAAAVASVLNGYCPKGADIDVKLRGGTLTIRYTDEEVTMTGPARVVFEGVVTL